MTIQLLFDGRHIRASGIGVYSREQIKHLGEWAKTTGTRVAVLGVPQELGELDPALEIVATAPGQAPMYSLQEQRLFAAVHGKIKPKVFWTPHYPYPAFAPRARTFVTIHDVLHVLPRAECGAGLAKAAYAKRMMRMSLSQSKGVFVPSQSTKDEITRLFGPRENVVVAPMRINNAWLSSSAKSEIPKGLPQNYVLFVGNVKRHKNLLGLLDAYSMVQDKTGADLVLAGGAANVRNEDPKVLKRLAGLKSRVHLMGNLSFDHLKQTVSNASCLVMPSFYEGVGLPPLEAMAVGTPVAASDIPSLRETCGTAAVYFDPFNPATIADSILQVLRRRELQEDLRQQGQMQVQRREAQVDPLLPLKIISERCL